MQDLYAERMQLFDRLMDEQIQRIESDSKRAAANAAIASLFEPKEGENGDSAD